MLDLLLVNGRLEDPFAGLSGAYDIGVRHGRIVGVYPSGTTLPESRERLDLAGYIMSPGWIDLHTHVYPGKTPLGIDADTVGVKQGVTTILDAGSAGWRTYGDFAATVAESAATRVLSWLNIAGAGLCGGLSELAAPEDIDLDAAAKLIERMPAIRGIKVRMSSSVLGASGIRPLKQAKELSRRVGRPLMVHIGNGPPTLAAIFDELDRGDVVTHAFHGKKGGGFDTGGAPLPEMLAARRRGVCLDIGHGTSSFAFRRLEHALAAGIWPDTVSTDIYHSNYNGPVYSLARTLEKCLALGMTLGATLAAVTVRPAVLIGLPELGTVRVGGPADLTVFCIEEKKREFVDAEGDRRVGAHGITVWGAVRAGKVWRCNG